MIQSVLPNGHCQIYSYLLQMWKAKMVSLLQLWQYNSEKTIRTTKEHNDRCIVYGVLYTSTVSLILINIAVKVEYLPLEGRNAECFGNFFIILLIYRFTIYVLQIDLGSSLSCSFPSTLNPTTHRIFSKVHS